MATTLLTDSILVSKDKEVGVPDTSALANSIPIITCCIYKCQINVPGWDGQHKNVHNTYRLEMSVV